MRYLRLFISLLCLASLFTSCEKVIDIDLNNAGKKYVIEAVVTDQVNTALVQISQTKNFDEDNTFLGVSGALVSITEEGEVPVLFTETSDGVYRAPAFTATSGKTYSLDVTIGTETFTATCRMPVKVNLDSLFVTDEFLFTDTRKIANVAYKDPPGKGNNYRFIQYVNGMKEKQVFIQNDDYTDARNVTAKLFFFADDDEEENQIKSGDILKVDLLCIDPAVYKYWYSLLRSATGTSGQATPANPVSNIKGGALGYFSAHTLQTETISVP